MNFFSFLLGMVLIVGIVCAGYYATIHSKFVIWFGVITAIVAPLAFEFLISPFKSNEKRIIKKLSQVPEIEQLIQNAQDSQSKIKLLEKQRRELDKLIAYEVQQKMLMAERAIFILQGREALKKVTEINESLGLLIRTKQEMPEDLKPLISEIEKIEYSDLTYTIGDKKFRLKQKYFSWFPFYGNSLFEIMKQIKKTSKI